MARAVIKVDLAGTKEQIRQRIIATAKARHAEVMATEPRPDSFTRVVGGLTGAREESIRLGAGGISYFYERRTHIVEQALALLRDMSPKRSGAYRDGHMMLINGNPVLDLSGYREGDEVSITNVMPYARRLEVGKTESGRDFVMQVPSRIYFRAAQALRRKYRNQVDIEMTFRAFLGGGQVDQAKTATVRFRHNRKAADAKHAALNGAHNQANMRYPTLVFHAAGSQMKGRRRR